MCSGGSLTLLRLARLASVDVERLILLPCQKRKKGRKKNLVNLVCYPSPRLPIPGASSSRHRRINSQSNYCLHPLAHLFSPFFFSSSLQRAGFHILQPPYSHHLLYFSLQNLPCLTHLPLITLRSLTPSSSSTLILFLPCTSLSPSSHPASLCCPSL